MTPRHRQTSRAGFTVTELLCVMGVLAILAVLLFPSVTSARRAMRNTQCLSNLRQLGQAMQLYAMDHDNALPAGGAQGVTASNWVFRLTGFLDNSTDYTQTKYGGKLATIGNGRKSILLCKQNILNAGAGVSGSSATTYGMNELLFGKTLTAIAAPAETCLIGEMTSSSGSFYMSTNRGNSVAAKVHGGHTNVLYVDGHVASLDAVPLSATEAGFSVFWGL